MKIKKIIFLLPVLALSACADKPNYVDLNLKYVTAHSTPIKTVDQRSQAALAETAQSVNSSLQQLSAMQIATHPDVAMSSPADPAAIHMAQQTSLDWTGPLEPLLDKIASASGYQVQVLGKKPAIPVIVVINARDELLANILRDTTYQVAQKARIKLYPQKKIIELRYLSS